MLGDANRLQRVPWNLLSNAVEFTAKGGRIDVSVGRRGTFIEIGVSDTGKGIGADFPPYVFDPFRQGDGRSRARRGGWGWNRAQGASPEAVAVDVEIASGPPALTLAMIRVAPSAIRR